MSLGVSFFRFGNDRSVWRSYGADFTIDVSLPKAGDIESDLLKRDLSINAMAYDFATQSIIDPLNGKSDLKNRIIRIISENAIKDDPLRMLRAFRIAAELKFKISDRSLLLIEKNKKLIRHISSERIGYEFLKLIATESYEYLVEMNRVGLIDQMFVNFRYANECTQNRFHLYDVKDHSLLTVRKIDEMICDIDNIVKHNTELKELIKKNMLILKVAALFHDIGKPFVKTNYGGSIHFYRHESKGAKIFNEKIAPRLSLAKKESLDIKKLILYHLAVADYFRLFREKRMLKKHKVRFFSKYDELGVLILFLSIADTLAKGQISQSLFVDMHKMFIELSDFYFNYYLPKKQIAPLINGYDIIREFQLKPSPVFKTILKKIREEQIKGAIKNRSEAIEYAAEIVKNLKKADL
ncbi:MAG TPA: CCA tRNA nucleotidyltransferase [Deltaproteobacteria bacterium]|nr:CCA tRNA nucleotidyltransferase [Deltaproteobacteria bacterium]